MLLCNIGRQLERSSFVMAPQKVNVQVELPILNFVIIMHCALGLLDQRTSYASYAIQLLSICLGRGKGQALLTIFEVCVHVHYSHIVTAMIWHLSLIVGRIY